MIDWNLTPLYTVFVPVSVPVCLPENLLDLCLVNLDALASEHLHVFIIVDEPIGIGVCMLEQLPHQTALPIRGGLVLQYARNVGNGHLWDRSNEQTSVTNERCTCPDYFPFSFFASKIYETVLFSWEQARMSIFPPDLFSALLSLCPSRNANFSFAVCILLGSVLSSMFFLSFFSRSEFSRNESISWLSLPDTATEKWTQDTKIIGWSLFPVFCVVCPRAIYAVLTPSAKGKNQHTNKPLLTNSWLDRAEFQLRSKGAMLLDICILPGFIQNSMSSKTHHCVIDINSSKIFVKKNSPKI